MTKSIRRTVPKEETYEYSLKEVRSLDVSVKELEEGDSFVYMRNVNWGIWDVFKYGDAMFIQHQKEENSRFYRFYSKETGYNLRKSEASVLRVDLSNAGSRSQLLELKRQAEDNLIYDAMTHQVEDSLTEAILQGDRFTAGASLPCLR